MPLEGVWSPTLPRLRGTYFTPFPPKRVKNGQKGGTPVFDPFSGRLLINGYPLVWPLGGPFRAQVGSLGREKGTSGRFLEVGAPIRCNL